MMTWINNGKSPEKIPPLNLKIKIKNMDWKMKGQTMIEKTHDKQAESVTVFSKEFQQKLSQCLTLEEITAIKALCALKANRNLSDWEFPVLEENDKTLIERAAIQAVYGCHGLSVFQAKQVLNRARQLIEHTSRTVCSNLQSHPLT